MVDGFSSIDRQPRVTVDATAVAGPSSDYLAKTGTLLFRPRKRKAKGRRAGLERRRGGG
jgi:hypothetical protein